MLAGAYTLHEFPAGNRLRIGPFSAETRLLPLPHGEPNAGLRLNAGGRVLAYTGDTGPSTEVVALARGADMLLAEATYVDNVPENLRLYLTSARQAGRQAAVAGATRLLLTHLWPGTDPGAAKTVAGSECDGQIGIATAGLIVDV